MFIRIVNKNWIVAARIKTTKITVNLAIKVKIKIVTRETDQIERRKRKKRTITPTQASIRKNVAVEALSRKTLKRKSNSAES